MEDLNLSSESAGDHTVETLSTSLSTCFFSDVIVRTSTDQLVITIINTSTTPCLFFDEVYTNKFLSVYLASITSLFYMTNDIGHIKQGHKHTTPN